MIKCKYEGTGIWNGRCVGTKEVDPCPGYDKCKQYKPNYTTNADRTRAMSDEELVVFLDEFSSRCLGCVGDAKNQSCPIYKEGHYCRPQDIMKWLQNPADGDDHAYLKPCPFCGGKDSGILTTSYDGYWFAVFCENCMAQTRKCRQEKDAVEAWNRRVGEVRNVD